MRGTISNYNGIMCAGKVSDMTLKEKAQYAAARVTLNKLLGYVEKDPEKNLVTLIDRIEGVAGKIFPSKYFQRFRDGARDKDNVYRRLALDILAQTDRSALIKMFLALGLGGVNGTSTVRKNREIYDCNIPFIILLDPTSACNRHCKGCWSAEYGHEQSLSNAEMESIVSQGAALGTRLFMFTGGEPLIRKKDVLTLCANHPECAFLAYTNATLIDDAFCEELKRVGNLAIALSIEGSRETNDARRGEGSFDTAMNAAKLMKKHGCLFGMSVCYTSNNIEYVTSDAFIDDMTALGVRFGLYFNYMPVGHDAVPELIPRPEQRVHMYKWLRRVRNAKEGKPIFIMDFQNDAEYVGGCIAGGRNYFHINSAGDIEPCVFIHYSDSNIRKDTLLEALHNPLFQAYWKNQPFNDNHLRPCPMLENPECLRRIVNETGAKSTDLIKAEDVESLCSKCDRYAAAWEPVANELWNSTTHPTPKTQFYRDIKK